MQTVQEGHGHAKHRGQGRAGRRVEGVSFEPAAAAQKAGLKRAGLPWTLEPGWGWSRMKGAPAPHPQVLPGFTLLSWDHGSETIPAAP